MFSKIINLVRPYWQRIAAAALISLLISGLNGGIAWLVKPALDGIFLRKDATLLALLPFAILGIFLLRGIFGFFQNYLMGSTGVKVMRDIRNRLYGHLLLLPVNEFKKESTSTLLSRMINDAGLLQGLLAFVVKDLFVETGTVLVLISIAFYRKWELAVLAVIVLPAAFYGVRRLGKRLKKVAKAAQAKISVITEFLSETFSGIKMVKVFGREDALTSVFEDKNQEYYRDMMRSTRIVEFTTLMMEAVSGLGIAFVLWYGGKLVVRDVITPGDFFSFLTAVFMMFTPAKRLANANNNIQKARAALERIDEMFDKEKERDGTKVLSPINDCIEFSNVRFRYPSSKHDILKDIDLKVKKGEITAIVGRSGAGKTSFADLIPRFHDPVSGTISIDGMNIADATLRSLRRQIGLVSQDIILFNDTARANIAFGNPDASEDDIIRAAKAAHAHEFILELPEGYDTIIGERGVMVSGGQRQRLSIARAILKNPPILILDEATSSLDTESEMMVQKALDALMESRTTFVIAHRLSTVKKADRIVVLEKGKIAEMGPHEELLKRDGLYRKLYDLQISPSSTHDEHNL